MNKFENHIKEAARRLKELNPKTVRVVSHLDTDGICSCSLLVKALSLLDIEYSCSIVHQIDEKVVSELSTESYECIIFSDLGSGQLELIEEKLGGKKIFILDHHEPQEKTSEDIVHVNPHLFGINGSSEISGAGVVYLFARELNPLMEDYAHIAVIGAVGDVQDKEGFSELNKAILDTAVSKGKIKVINGLQLFGAQTKPLHKTLQYNTDPYIPGISGSESGSIQFLKQIGIEPKEKGDWRKLIDLSEKELQTLVEGILMQEPEAESIVGPVYILDKERKGSPFREVKEFSTLLNACGRMDCPSIGIGSCLGDPNMKRKALENLGNYKREIVDAMRWYNDEANSKYVIRGDKYLIINAGENIRPTIIGTVASIISNSPDLEEGTFILTAARMHDDKTKASIRITGHNQNVELNQIMNNVIEKLGYGLAGGHENAAGAMFPTRMEEEFIEISRKHLEHVTPGILHRQ